jgi:hypothetical protein
VQQNGVEERDFEGQKGRKDGKVFSALREFTVGKKLKNIFKCEQMSENVGKSGTLHFFEPKVVLEYRGLSRFIPVTCRFSSLSADPPIRFEGHQPSRSPFPQPDGDQSRNK